MSDEELPTVVVYGGSFDPPHVGHLMAAAWALAVTGADELLVVPAYEHPLGKQARTAFEHRFAMCERLFGELGRARVSDIERELGGASRTLRTLEELHARRPGTRFRLLIGTDILAQTDRWHRWEDVARLAPPLVVSRGGYPMADGCPVPLPSVSSTDLRGRLARGEETVGLLPARVRRYVEEHGIYAREEA